MRETTLSRLRARFAMYDDLIAAVDDDLLARKLDIAKHKSLAEHLWCVVGARESYAKALAAGEWVGFACSLQNFTQADFATALTTSADAVLAACDGVQDWTDQRADLLATLAEHEVMHEGQIIRHMYGLEQPMPEDSQWA